MGCLVEDEIRDWEDFMPVKYFFVEDYLVTIKCNAVSFFEVHRRRALY